MSTSTPAFSFDRARFAGDPPPSECCAFCHRGLRSEYFRVNGQTACATCALRVGSFMSRDSHKAFSRAVLFGLGAAVVGCMGYALFEILTGIMLGWISLGVGLLIGWAMKKGSRGAGGRRYQITGAFLTYAAVAVAFVPVALHQTGLRHTAAAATVHASPNANISAAPAADSSANQAANQAPAANAKPHTAAPGVVALLALLGLGLISPFLILSVSLGQGLLNLFILAIGVHMAWKQTAAARPTVEGPFEQTPPRAPAAI